MILETQVSTRLTIITKTDLLAYIRNELDSESRKVVDHAMELDPTIRSIVANCDEDDHVPPMQVRHDDRVVHLG